MAETQSTVLDHIDMISVPGNVFAAPANQFWALVCCHDGMSFLYRQAKHYDVAVNSRIAPGLSVFGMNLEEFDSVPQSLLTIGFHWYAISAYQYALIVGSIARSQGGRWASSDKYVEEVMPEIFAFSQ